MRSENCLITSVAVCKLYLAGWCLIKRQATRMVSALLNPNQRIADLLENLGIVREITGRPRSKIFVYSEYLATLQEGTSIAETREDD